MAYTDRQTGQVYTVFSLILLLLETGLLADGILMGRLLSDSPKTDLLYLAVFLSGYLLAADCKLLGMGDVLIFMVLAFFYCNLSEEPVAVLFFNAMLAHVLFLLGNLPKYFQLGKHERNQPFTLSIAAAACITVMVLV